MIRQDTTRVLAMKICCYLQHAPSFNLLSMCGNFGISQKTARRYINAFFQATGIRYRSSGDFIFTVDASKWHDHGETE